MTDALSKSQLADELRTTFDGVTNTVNDLNEQQFERVTGEEWSAAGYLMHLILSVKPFARALSLPPEKLLAMFGAPERASLSYDELVALYHNRLDEGVKAENVPSVTPAEYPLPEGTSDLKDTLLKAWIEGGERLLQALGQIDDEMLDSHQLPHPAVGLLTLREMLYFTIYHNTMHWRDIERIAAAGDAVNGAT